MGRKTSSWIGMDTFALCDSFVLVLVTLAGHGFVLVLFCLAGHSFVLLITVFVLLLVTIAGLTGGGTRSLHGKRSQDHTITQAKTHVMDDQKKKHCPEKSLDCSQCFAKSAWYWSREEKSKLRCRQPKLTVSQRP